MAVIDEVEEEEVVEEEKIEETAVVSDTQPVGSDKKSKKKKGQAAGAEPVVPAPPAAPAAPEIKLSQILPMVAMLALQKFDLEQLGYVRHVEVGYVIVQILCFAVHYVVHCRISGMKDDGGKIKIPEVKQLGQVVAPAKAQTRKEYDLDQWKEAVKQPLIGFVILGGIYYKWGSLMPLVMQLLMTPMTVYEAPLTQIHILGKEKSRPFPKANPFGMPSAPEPEAQAIEEEEEDSSTSSPAQGKKDKLVTSSPAEVKKDK